MNNRFLHKVHPHLHFSMIKNNKFSIPIINNKAVLTNGFVRSSMLQRRKEKQQAKRTKMYRNQLYENLFPYHRAHHIQRKMISIIHPGNVVLHLEANPTIENFPRLQTSNEYPHQPLLVVPENHPHRRAKNLAITKYHISSLSISREDFSSLATCEYQNYLRSCRRCSQSILSSQSIFFQSNFIFILISLPDHRILRPRNYSKHWPNVFLNI